jgi:hypothetical protein
MLPLLNNLRRMRPKSVAALFGGLVLTILGATAGAAEPRLEPYSRSPEMRIEALPTRGGASPRLRLQGMWPTPCRPSVESVNLDGSEVRITLRSLRPLCARAPLPFDLEVDLGKRVGKNWPATPLRVSVLAANSATAEPQLRGFALIEPSAVHRPMPASGLWWPLPEADASNPMAGTGFSIELQFDTLAIAVLGRTPKGKPTWYFGTGKLRGRSARIDLIAAGNSGREPEADADASDIGNATLHMDFEGNGRATAWLDYYDLTSPQPLLRQQVINLAHLPFTEHTDGSAWDGDWVLLGATPGQPRSARQIHLNGTGFSATAEYRLSASDGSVMACEVDPAESRLAPPRRCSLRDSSGKLIAEFDSVDINLLDGHAPDRTPVQLLRVERR